MSSAAVSETLETSSEPEMLYIGHVQYMPCAWLKHIGHVESVRRAYEAALPFLEQCCDSLIHEAGWKTMTHTDFRFVDEREEECPPFDSNGCASCSKHKPIQPSPPAGDRTFARCLYAPSEMGDHRHRMIIMLPKTADVFLDDKNYWWLSDWISKLPAFWHKMPVAGYSGRPVLQGSEWLMKFVGLLQIALPGQLAFLTLHPSIMRRCYEYDRYLVHARFFPETSWCLGNSNVEAVRQVLQARLMPPGKKLPDVQRAVRNLEEAHGCFDFTTEYRMGIGHARHHTKRHLPFRYCHQFADLLLTPPAPLRPAAASSHPPCSYTPPLHLLALPIVEERAHEDDGTSRPNTLLRTGASSDKTPTPALAPLPTSPDSADGASTNPHLPALVRNALSALRGKAEKTQDTAVATLSMKRKRGDEEASADGIGPDNKRAHIEHKPTLVTVTAASAPGQEQDLNLQSQCHTARRSPARQREDRPTSGGIEGSAWKTSKRPREDPEDTEDSRPEKKLRANESVCGSPPATANNRSRVHPTALTHVRPIPTQGRAGGITESELKERALREQILASMRRKARGQESVEVAALSAPSSEAQSETRAHGEEASRFDAPKERDEIPAARLGASSPARAGFITAVFPLPAAVPYSSPSPSPAESPAPTLTRQIEPGMPRAVKAELLAEPELRQLLLQSKGRKKKGSRSPFGDQTETRDPTRPATPALIEKGGSPPSSPVGPAEAIETKEEEQIPGLDYFYGRKSW